MIVRGHVRNGSVVLDDPMGLPEGAAVEVEPVDHGFEGTSKGHSERDATEAGQAGQESGEVNVANNHYQHYKDIIGTAMGLPPDASINKYHYLYGHPKI